MRLSVAQLLKRSLSKDTLKVSMQSIPLRGTSSMAITPLKTLKRSLSKDTLTLRSTHDIAVDVMILGGVCVCLGNV